MTNTPTLEEFKAEHPNLRYNRLCLKAVLEGSVGDTCPKCEVSGVIWYPITGRKGFICSNCDVQIFPLANTIFRKSQTPLTDWFYIVYLFSISKNGVSAKEVERAIGVSYKTAWRMCNQIRQVMNEPNSSTTIKGSSLFWSNLMRSIDGTYHMVSQKYLQQYIGEFIFRHNHKDTSVFSVLLKRVGV